VNAQREENVTFRILSAIGIILVVMGHMGYNQFEFEMWLPYYSFHMALFAFISGYFYSSKNDDHIGRFLLKKTKTILLQYFAVSLLYLLIQTLLKSRGVTFGLEYNIYNWLIRPWVRCQPLGFNIATWFMIALFITETIYIFLRAATKMIPNDRLRDVLLLLLIGVGASAVITNSPYPEEWQRVWLRPIFLCFFCHSGYSYRKYIEGKIRVSKSVLLLSMFLIRALLISGYGKVDYGLWNCDFGGIPWWVVILTTIIGISFWLIVAKTISTIVSKDGILVQIGRHTREIMSHHLFTAFLWHGAIYFCYQFLSLGTPFNIGDWKEKLYFRYEPWGGYSLITTVVSISLVLVAVRFRDKCIAKVKDRFRYGNKLWAKE